MSWITDRNKEREEREKRKQERAARTGSGTAAPRSSAQGGTQTVSNSGSWIGQRQAEQTERKEKAQRRRQEQLQAWEEQQKQWRSQEMRRAISEEAGDLRGRMMRSLTAPINGSRSGPAETAGAAAEQTMRMNQLYQAMYDDAQRTGNAELARYAQERSQGAVRQAQEVYRQQRTAGTPRIPAAAQGALAAQERLAGGMQYQDRTPMDRDTGLQARAYEAASRWAPVAQAFGDEQGLARDVETMQRAADNVRRNEAAERARFYRENPTERIAATMTQEEIRQRIRELSAEPTAEQTQRYTEALDRLNAENVGLFPNENDAEVQAAREQYRQASEAYNGSKINRDELRRYQQALKLRTYQDQEKQVQAISSAAMADPAFAGTDVHPSASLQRTLGTDSRQHDASERFRLEYYSLDRNTERKVFNYLWNKDEAAGDTNHTQAMEYLRTIPDLEERYYTAYANKWYIPQDYDSTLVAADKVLSYIVDSLLSGSESALAQGMDALAGRVPSGEARNTRELSAAMQNSGMFYRALGGAAQSAGRMLPSMMAGNVAAGFAEAFPVAVASIAEATGGVVTGARIVRGVQNTAFFLTSKGAALQEGMKKGLDRGQAEIYSTLSALSEVGLQDLIGGIASFGGISERQIAAKIAKIDNVFLRTAAHAGANILGEEIEENAQNWLEPLIISMLTGEEFQAPTWEETLDTILSTALMVGGMNVGDTASYYSSSKIRANLRSISDTFRAEGGDYGRIAADIDAWIKEVDADPEARYTPEDFGKVFDIVGKGQAAMREHDVTPQDIAETIRAKQREVDRETGTAGQQTAQAPAGDVGAAAGTQAPGQTEETGPSASASPALRTTEETSRELPSAALESVEAEGRALGIRSAQSMTDAEIRQNVEMLVELQQDPGQTEAGSASLRGQIRGLQEVLNERAVARGDDLGLAEGLGRIGLEDVGAASQSGRQIARAAGDGGAIRGSLPAKNGVGDGGPVPYGNGGLNDERIQGGSEVGGAGGQNAGTDAASSVSLGGRQLVRAAGEQGIVAGDAGAADGGERDAGLGAAGSAGILGEGAGRAEGRAAERGGSRKEELAAIRHYVQAQGTERRSARDIGIRDGTKNARNVLLEGEALSDGMVRLQAEAEQAGTRLDFVTGQIETRTGGQVRTAAGVFQIDADGTPHIFVQADSRARTPEQLYRHELYHFIVAQNRSLWQQIVEHLNRNYTQEEIASIVGSYIDAFEGCYGYGEADVEAYLEEIFADIYAEMDRGGGRERASREALQPVAQRFAGDIENARQNRAGIERRNGPGTRLSAEDNSRLNQEDLDEYLSVGNTGHVRDKKQDQVKAGESPILNSPAEIYDFIDRSIHGEIRDTIKAYGKVGSRMASDVQSKDASVNIQGYYLEIESNHFSHLSDHIDKDNDYRNIPLTEEEVKNIPYYLDSYDDVLTVTRKKDGAVKIKFGKRINGHCIIVETVSKGRKAIHTRTAWKMDTVDYLAKYKMNGSATPKRASANSSQGAGPFTSSISQSNGKNNTSATKNTGKDWVYLDAVKKGWTQEVQWMVEDAAKRAGFTHKGFHQTGADFTSFSTKNEVAGQFDDETPTGIFIKPTDEDIGLQSGTKQMPLFFKADNMLEFANREEIRKYWIENVPGYRELDAQLQARNREMERQYDELDAEWDRIYRETYDSDDQSALDEVERRQDEFLERWNRELQPLRRQMKNLITEYMKGTDYDGIHLQYDGKVYGGPRVETYIVFNPEQVKSAEPIVRDDSGNVIPLSERFRTDRTGTEAWKNRDIRFSPSEEEDEGVDWIGKDPDYMDSLLRAAERMEALKSSTEKRRRQVQYAEESINVLAPELTERSAQNAGYPMIDGKQVYPHRTFVQDKERGNYGLVVDLAGPGKLWVKFENKHTERIAFVAKAFDEIIPVEGVYQMTESEEDQYLEALNKDPENQEHVRHRESFVPQKDLEEYYTRINREQEAEEKAAREFNRKANQQSLDATDPGTVDYRSENYARLRMEEDQGYEGVLQERDEAEREALKAAAEAEQKAREKRSSERAAARKTEQEKILRETKGDPEKLARIKKEKKAEKATVKNLKNQIKKSEENVNAYKKILRESLTNRPDEVKRWLRDAEETLEINRNALKRKKTEPEKKPARPIKTAKQARKEFREGALDLFGVPSGKRQTLGNILNDFADRMIEQGFIDESDRRGLFRTLYDSGVEVMPADEYYQSIRDFVSKGRIYVPDSVRADFGDDWTNFRNRAWGNRIYLTSDKTDMGIDSWQSELAEAFPGSFDAEELDARTMLENLVDLAEAGQGERVTIGEMMQRNFAETGMTVDQQMDELEQKVDQLIDTFAQKASLERKVRTEGAMKLAMERKRNRERVEREHQRRRENQTRAEVMKQLQQLKKMRRKSAPEIREKIDAIIGNLDTMARQITPAGLENLQELARKYNEAKDDPNFLGNPYVEQRLARLGQVQLDDLEISDVIELGRTIAGLVKAVQENKQLLTDARNAEISAAAEEAAREIRESAGSKGGKLRDFFGKQHLSPTRLIQMLGGWTRGGRMEQLAQALEDGGTRRLEYMRQATRIFDGFTSDKANQKWLRKAQGKDAEWISVTVPVGITDAGGTVHVENQTIEITPMMRVGLLMHSRNADNLRHIETGGIVIPDKGWYRKGNLAEADARGTRVKLRPETVRAIVKDCTAQERAFAALLEKYYDGFSKDRINEVSMEIDGFERAGGDHYYGIKVSRKFLAAQPEQIQRNMALESIGSIVNERIHAGTPIILEDASTALTDHIDLISKYYGFTAPIRDFNAVMNYTFHEKAQGEDGEYVANAYAGSIKEILQDKWGSGAQAYLDKMLADLQQSSGVTDSVAQFMAKLRGNLAGASLMFNPAVALSQTASLPGAMQSLGPAALMAGLKPAKVDMGLVEKYSPVLWYRNQGNSTQELGDYLKAQGFEGKLPWFFGWIQKMDSWTIRRLWAAAEYKVRHETDLTPGSQAEIDAGTDPFYQEVARYFQRAVYDTQPNYTEMQRPGVLRTESDLMKFMTMYKTVPLQYYNMMFEAAGRWKADAARAKANDNKANRENLKKSRSFAVQTFAGILGANVVYVVMKAAIKALTGRGKKYEDEEGDITLQSALPALGKDLAETYAGSLIFGSELLSSLEKFYDAATTGSYSRYGGMEISAFSAIEDTIGELYNLASRLQKEDYRGGLDAIKELAKQLAMDFGFPANNVETYLMGVARWISPEWVDRYENLFDEFERGDMAGLHGRELEAGIRVLMDNRTDGLKDETISELARLFGVGYNQQLPAGIPSKVTVDGEEIQLGWKDREQYRETWSQVVQEQMETLLASDGYEAADDKGKADLIKKLYDYAAQTAAGQVTGKSMDNWVLFGKACVDAGIPLEDYLAIAAVSKDKLKDMDGTELDEAIRARMNFRVGELDDEVLDELGRLYEGGASGVIPSDVPTSFSVAGEEIKLTPEQRVSWMQAWQRTAGESLGALLDSQVFRKASDEDKAKLIGALYDVASAAAKSEIQPGYEPDKWIRIGREAEARGISMSDYIVYRKAASGASKAADKLKILQDQKWTQDQKAFIWEQSMASETQLKKWANLRDSGVKWKDAMELLGAGESSGNTGMSEAEKARYDVEVEKISGPATKRLLNNSAYKKADKATKAAYLDRLNDYAGKLAKSKIIKGFDAGKWVEQGERLTKAGVQLDEYIVYYAGISDANSRAKYEALANTRWSESQKMIAMEYISTKTAGVAEVGRSYQVGLSWYLEGLTRADANANGSISQEEAEAYLDGIDLGREDKAYLWQMLCSSSKWKKNPYSTVAGEEIWHSLNPEG